jgi:hypothetical protein
MLDDHDVRVRNRWHVELPDSPQLESWPLGGNKTLQCVMPIKVDTVGNAN